MRDFKIIFLIFNLFYSTLGLSVIVSETTIFDLPSHVLIEIASKIALNDRSNIIKLFLFLQNKSYQKSNKKETSEKWNARMKHFTYSMLFSEKCQLRFKTQEKIDLFLEGMKTNNYLDEKSFQALKILKGLLQEEPDVCKNLLKSYYDRFEKNILHFAAAQGDVFLIRLLFKHAKELVLYLEGEKDVFQKTPFQIAKASIFKTKNERKNFIEDKQALKKNKKIIFLLIVFFWI